MKMDYQNRQDSDISVLEKMRKLVDGAVVSKFAPPADCRSYRKGVQECISILEKEYDLRYS